MPFVDVVGKDGTAAPAQIVVDVPKLNVGVMFGFTVSVNVVATAHNPAEGVKVYTAEAVLLTVAALHVPPMPFVDVPGNTGTASPSQITNVVPKPKLGVTFGLTVTLKVVLVAHCPAEGVKV